MFKRSMTHTFKRVWSLPQLPAKYVVETEEGLKITDMFLQIETDYKGHHPNRFPSAALLSESQIMEIINSQPIKNERLEIRIPSDLKDKFAAWCTAIGTTPSDELRKCITKLITEPKGTK